MKRIKKNKIKTNLDIVKEQRNLWVINPKTRVKSNDLKNKKKRRNKEKKMIDSYYKGDQSFFFISKYLV